MAPTPKPAHFTLDKAIRSNILALQPYRCARDDYDEGILLDANENALGHALPPPTTNPDEGAFDDLSLHRYPSPLHLDLKQQICAFRNVPSPTNIFLGVGSDEAIDLLFRIACIPGKDRVLVCPPTYGMYSVCAQINDVEVVKLNLDVEGGAFRPKVDEINATLSAAAKSPNPIKLTFLCSPGNPTGTSIPLDDIRAVLANPDYTGLVIVDEAYVDFGPEGSSAIRLLVEEGWSNLVVLQTLSKGFGLAAIRLGLAFSSPEIIQVLNNIKAPYNISTPTAALAKRALSPSGLTLFRANLSTLIANRSTLSTALLALPSILQILGAPHANFVLAQVGGKDGKPDNVKAQKVYEKMAREDKVVVRFRGNEVGCEACLRITVGTKEECEAVVEKLAKLLEE
ncbi:pyridoxal phosphate-dependent transferase [Leucosporidium creatinivorum]|uniref:histidinol-phosphate transaminase n=1 Tax=Leucosporidium creatinivorum TaxID=106004 RepID=A0A1Y2FVA8_9BASI|nr:pyridoxal phosphate-dependent transferase [Leucosporidium creatinivorum]